MKRYTATAASNIAFVKYWGKADAAAQWPANDSLSMTLRNSVSHTSAEVIDAEDHLVTFDGVPQSREQSVGGRIFRHLDRLAEHGSFTDNLQISTKNTFPAGCGIASSASGFAALTIAALASWTKTDSIDALVNESLSPGLLANFARLGSGSACRSLFGGFVVWRKGKIPERQLVKSIADSSHWRLADLIVVVAAEKKTISSTEGHKSAWSSPLFATRLAGIPERIRMMKQAIAQRDIERMGRALEDEALDMHAVMMTSQPALSYLHEDTYRVLQWVRQYRSKHAVPVYFTLDAGPTVHLICEQNDAPQIYQALLAKFPAFSVIQDEVGQGPQLIAQNIEHPHSSETSGSHEHAYA